MALVGYAIGQVSGRGYWDTMNTFLTHDLEMTSSYTGIKPSKNLPGFNKKNQNIGNWDFQESLTAAAGDISATADDLLTYAEKHIKGELPYLALTHEKQVMTGKGKTGSGLAWFIHGEQGEIIEHIGSTGAFDSLMVIDKDKKLAYVILSNYLIPVNKLKSIVVNEIQKIL